MIYSLNFTSWEYTLPDLLDQENQPLQNNSESIILFLLHTLIPFSGKRIGLKIPIIKNSKKKSLEKSLGLLNDPVVQ